MMIYTAYILIGIRKRDISVSCVSLILGPCVIFYPKKGTYVGKKDEENKKCRMGRRLLPGTVEAETSSGGNLVFLSFIFIFFFFFFHVCVVTAIRRRRIK